MMSEQNDIMSILVSALGIEDSLMLGIEQIINRGQVNDVYKVTYGSDPFVLRVNKRTEHDRFLKEKWCADRAFENDVLTPEVIDVGVYAKMAYMLLRYVDGKNGDDITSTDDVWMSLGVNLAQIHTVATLGYGEAFSDMTHRTRANWKKFINNNTSALVDDRRFMSRANLSDIDRQAMLLRFSSLRQTEFSFGLSHGDYSLANTIVSEDQYWIIDWGSASSNVVPHHDFSVILEESLNENSSEFEAFLQGYGMEKESYDHIKYEVESLRLLEALDKLRWAHDKAPRRVTHYSHRLQALLGATGD